MDRKIIKRDLFEDIKQHLSQKEITLLVGPRQVGKTTLLRLLEEDLLANGAKTLFLNLDIEQDFQFVSSQQTLVQHIRLALGAEGGYVFIDEAQRKPDAGRFFKGIYDMDLPYKFILSGSGSLELKEKIHESMTGRKRLFELLPVSFWEFAAFRTAYQYGDQLISFLTHDAIERTSLFEEYMRFGGYPQVILAAQAKEKQNILNEIYQSYLIRDISFLLGVEKTDAFTNLVRLLASQTGSLVAVSELASTLGISTPTVKQYLWYLEKTFIMHRVSPYVRNARSEITKMPTFYFYDLGLRNFAGESSKEGIIPDGFLFENFIFLLLRGRGDSFLRPVHFWRTKSGAEVDFVIEQGVNPVPIEVKYAAFRKPIIGKSLRSFIERYQPDRAYIVTKDYSHEVSIGATTVNFVPFYLLKKAINVR
jgi:predicted AAA+ superfamily ATPase